MNRSSRKWLALVIHIGEHSIFEDWFYWSRAWYGRVAVYVDSISVS